MPNPADNARSVIQQVVDAATRNPHNGAYIGCDHYRMKVAVARAEQWLKDNPHPALPDTTRAAIEASGDAE